MQIKPLAIPDVLMITPARFADSRGWFSETWNEACLARAGLVRHFVQDNHSYSYKPGTIRGLHCQVHPHVQGKLVRCVRGAIWDVAVDARRGSAHYGQFAAAELSAANGAQLWIPEGFLHGFCTLAYDTEVFYKVTSSYDRLAERGVIWNDPDLAIPWPTTPEVAVVSEKDAIMPRLAELPDYFSF